MPKTPACTGAPAYGSPMQLSFTYPAADETTGLSVELPTSEPATAQVSYTIASGHLPTITGGNISYRMMPFTFIRGQNTSGSTRSISYRLEQNGTSIQTGTAPASVLNNYYWYLSLFNPMTSSFPAVGDVITVKLWASGAGVYLNNKGFLIAPYRVGWGSRRPVLLAGYAGAGAIVTEGSYFAPSWGTGAKWLQEYLINYVSNTNTCYMYPETGIDAPYLTAFHPDYGIGRVYAGDAGIANGTVGSGSVASGNNSTPAFRRITRLTYLPLNIKI